MVDQEVEECPTHQAYLGEEPRAEEMVYKGTSMVRERDARKWIQQNERDWKIIIDYLSLDIEQDLQRVPTYDVTGLIVCHLFNHVYHHMVFHDVYPSHIT